MSAPGRTTITVTSETGVTRTVVTSVVTVSNDGELTAIANGNAIITVTDGTTTELVPITVDTTDDRRPHWDNRDHGKNGNNGEDKNKGNNGNSDGDTTNRGNSNNNTNQSDTQNNGGGNKKSSYITPGCN